MSRLAVYSDEVIKNFHLPRWHELPEVDLYIDQVVSLLGKYLLSVTKDGVEHTPITKSMINNYVKMGLVAAPVKKKYSREHISHLFVIFILKQVYSIDEISKLISIAIKTKPVDQAYNSFCENMEKAVHVTFTAAIKSIDYSQIDTLTPEQYLLGNVALTIAGKILVQTQLNSQAFLQPPSEAQ